MDPIVKMEWFGHNYSADQYQAIATELRRVSAMIEFMEEYVSLDSKDVAAMLADIADGADLACDYVLKMHAEAFNVGMMEGAHG